MAPKGRPFRLSGYHDELLAQQNILGHQLKARAQQVSGEAALRQLASWSIGASMCHSRDGSSTRVSNHRFSRLTNGHSEMIQNHEAGIAIQFIFRNFCRPHMSSTERGVKMTPATAAGVAGRIWELDGGSFCYPGGLR